ncbi:Tetratricopeptide repeat protein [Gemmata sp. SH-PL17]|uniref:tetratricopeptide repeat protein n=1 Tax=Gemmata sp. SH-PL17 TaxID=1630693 RepID=UPI00078DF1E8|nr:tetratricopeptide repeat protein [Gemmata sp. SH-PL17]AMV26181.1 Tetratricopeptide repeat protein [Gemmata sp. SH-PL17]
MMPSGLRFAVGCVLAVVVPTCVLHFGAADERLAAGLTAPPFGWVRVLVAHLVTALPPGLLVAGWLRSVPAVNGAAPVLWVGTGVGVAALGTQVCAAFGEAVIGGEFGAVPLLVFRTTIAFTMVLPWCVWATDAPDSNARPLVNPGVLFGLAAGGAVLPCGLFAEAVIAARTEQAGDLIQRERVARADAVLTGLIELGSDRPIGKKLPAAIHKDLATVIPRLKRSGDQPRSANAKPSDQFNRALLMIQLDRLDEAAALLEALTANDTATLLLATVYRDQERWAESDELYSRVLEKMAPRTETNPPAHEVCFTALEGLTFNARADRRPADAERVLKRGLDLLPDRAAHFHFQLGRHYHDGGRPGLALEHLREATRLAPTHFGEPTTKLIRQIETYTPACTLWRAK